MNTTDHNKRVSGDFIQEMSLYGALVGFWTICNTNQMV